MSSGVEMIVVISVWVLGLSIRIKELAISESGSIVIYELMAYILTSLHVCEFFFFPQLEPMSKRMHVIRNDWSSPEVLCL